MRKSEKGIQKNLGNFEALMAHCASYSEKYNPGNPMLALTSLETRFNQAAELVKQEIETKKTLQNHTNYRAELFGGIGNLSARVINAMVSSGTSQAKLDDANEHHRKLNGRRAASSNKPKEKNQSENPGETPAVNTHSVSQLGFDNKIGHFKKLIATIRTEELYTPNEEELKLTTLEEMLQDMESINRKAKEIQSVWEQTLVARNEAFNNEKTGLIFIAKLIKGYVRSVYQPRSPESKQLSAYQFSKIK